MPPSLRFDYASEPTPPSTVLVPPSRPSSSETKSVSERLRFDARVPLPGLHSSNYATDAIRSHIHLSNERVIDVEPFEPLDFDDIAVREDDIPPNPDDDDELPSIHHPLQTLHHRPPSPPEFRDFRLPTPQTRRPDQIDMPTGILGTIPTGMLAGTYDVPFRVQSNGMGRRLPARVEGLNSLPARHPTVTEAQ